MKLFLLNDGGVRQVSVFLDLATGLIANENRTAFQYDSISSASIVEQGLRIDNSRIGAAAPGRGAFEIGRSSNKLVFSQEFTLKLNGLETVQLSVGNFDQGLIDKMREDPRHLFELARDTSGAAAALRILEAVAAEGRDWVRQERLRRHRRMMDYQRKRSLRLEIERASDGPTPPLGIDKVAAQDEPTPPFGVDQLRP